MNNRKANRALIAFIILLVLLTFFGFYLGWGHSLGDLRHNSEGNSVIVLVIIAVFASFFGGFWLVSKMWEYSDQPRTENKNAQSRKAKDKRTKRK